MNWTQLHLYRGDWVVGFKREGLGRAELGSTESGRWNVTKSGKEKWVHGKPIWVWKLALIQVRPLHSHVAVTVHSFHSLEFLRQSRWGRLGSSQGCSLELLEAMLVFLQVSIGQGWSLEEALRSLARVWLRRESLSAGLWFDEVWNEVSDRCCFF